MRTIKGIIYDAGGPAVLVEESKKTDHPFGSTALPYWYANGVPQKHWPLLVRLAGVSANELLEANLAVKKEARA